MKESGKSSSKICFKAKRKSNPKTKMIHFRSSTVWARIFSSRKSTKSRKAPNHRPPSQIACFPWTVPNPTSTQSFKTEVTSFKSTSMICLKRRKTSSQRKNWAFTWHKMDGKCRWFWLMIRIWYWWVKRHENNWPRSICMRKWRIRWKMGLRNGLSTSFHLKTEVIVKKIISLK